MKGPLQRLARKQYWILPSSVRPVQNFAIDHKQTVITSFLQQIKLSFFSQFALVQLTSKPMRNSRSNVCPFIPPHPVGLPETRWKMHQIQWTEWMQISSTTWCVQERGMWRLMICQKNSTSWVCAAICGHNIYFYGIRRPRSHGKLV